MKRSSDMSPTADNSRIAQIGSLTCGANRPLLLIAGPCVLQEQSEALEVAAFLKELATDCGMPFIFKASFDKANRTSLQSPRGPGLARGLEILAAVRETYNIPVTTDIHLPEQARPASKVCSLLQIPAFLARQTDLLIAAAQTDVAVNVKKGQFMAPAEMLHVSGKLRGSGCKNILFTERGTFFGYGRLVNDMTSIPEMQSFDIPVIFDATHSVQQPGGLGDATGGNRAMVPALAAASVAAGADGVFIETLPDPTRSPSDGANMVPLEEMPTLLRTLVAVRIAIQRE